MTVQSSVNGSSSRRMPHLWTWFRLPQQRPMFWFLIIAGVVQLYFLIFLIPGDPPDEAAHILRAASIALGHVLPISEGMQNGVAAWGGYVPRHLLEAVTNAPLGHYFFLLEPVKSAHVFAAFSNTAVYSPVVYLPAILAYLVGSSTGAPVLFVILLMRLANVLVFLALGLLSLVLLRKSSAKWLILVALLFPVSLYQASYVTGDTVTNGLLVLFVAYAIRVGLLNLPLGKGGQWGFYTVAALLCLLKPSYAPFLLLFLFLRELPLLARILVSALSLGLGIAWQVLIGKAAAGIPGIIPNRVDALAVSSHGQVEWLFQHPMLGISAFLRSFYTNGSTWMAGAIGQVGFMDDGNGNGVAVSVPVSALIACAMAMVLAIGIFPSVHSKRWGTAAVAVILSTILLILGSLYVTFTPVGKNVIWGAQGRYFYPLVVLGCAAAAVFVTARPSVPLFSGPEISIPVRRTETTILWIVSSALLITVSMHLIQYAWWRSGWTWPFGHH